MSNRKPLILESLLLDCATSGELATFNRLLAENRKGPATCFGMRVLRKYWAELINGRNNAEKTQEKSAREPQEGEFYIPRLLV